MIYKIYNESPEVGTAAKTLKSVICYNVCNMIEWGTRRAQMWHGAKKTGCKGIAARQPVNG